MDRLLRRENLDLRLTPYKVLATSSKHGFVQFIESHAVADVCILLFIVTHLINLLYRFMHTIVIVVTDCINKFQFSYVVHYTTSFFTFITNCYVKIIQSLTQKYTYPVTSLTPSACLVISILFNHFTVHFSHTHYKMHFTL